MEGAELSAAAWRRSSRSGPNGGNCVEVAAVWRKSNRSGSNGANCVEIAAGSRTVAVRDSKDRTGPALAFTGCGWVPFVAAVKGGRFDA